MPTITRTVTAYPDAAAVDLRATDLVARVVEGGVSLTVGAAVLLVDVAAPRPPTRE